MASRRVERVASLLKQAIGQVIVSDLSDPRMGFVTVVRVDPSIDLRSAKVFVSVLGEPADVSRTLHGLRHAARFIKRQVGTIVDMRSVPELVFVEDKSVKGAARVSRLIAEAMSQVKPAPPGEAAPDAAPAAPDISNEELEKLLQERKEEEGIEDEEEPAEDKVAKKETEEPAEKDEDEDDEDDELIDEDEEDDEDDSDDDVER